MKSAVTISQVRQARGGPFVFWDGLPEGCQQAAKLGFDGIEIFPQSARTIDPAELQGCLAKYHLQVAAVGTGAGWVIHRWSLTHADPAVRKKARDFIREIIGLAAEFNAPAVIGSMQGRWEGDVSDQQALGWLGEALEDLGAHAARGGQVLLYEPLNRYETNLFNRLVDASRFLETLSARNLKLLADLFHMNIEEESIPRALREAGRWIGHVHFADSNRRAVGLGHTQVEPIVEALRETGYQGYLSAEILPLPDSETAARITLESFRRYVH